MTSDSRSAIGFPNEGVGLNPGLLPLLGGPDRPTVDRHPPPYSLDPALAERRPVHGDELRIRQPHRHSPSIRRQAVADDEPAPDLWHVGLYQARDARIEAHHPEGSLVALES